MVPLPNDNLLALFRAIVDIESVSRNERQLADAVQDAFVQAFLKLDSFRGDAQFFTWLYRIATNETLNFLHKEKIRASLKFERLSVEMEEKIDDDPYFNGDGLQKELLKAIQRLPEKQRIVFTMRYFEDLSYEDLSEILDTSVGALKASYHFAAKKIRTELKKSSIHL